MMFRDFVDEKSEDVFLAGLARYVLQNIAQFAFQESRAYTLADILIVCKALLLGLPPLLLPGGIDPDLLEAVISSSYHKHLSSNTLARCRRCHKFTEPHQLFSGTFERPAAFVHWQGYLIEYFLLCSECVIELDYETQGLTHTCSLCSKRYAPPAYFSGARVDLQKLGVSERIRNEICVECITLPRILKEVKRVQSQLTRALSLSVPATLTIKQWMRTLAHFEWKCAYCQGHYDAMEHYVPLSLDGGTTADNCLPGCKQCNSRKNKKHPDEFASLFPVENMARITEYFNGL